MNPDLIVRMYRDHDYSPREIAQRLSLDLGLVIQVCNSKPAKDNSMIFPQMPRRTQYATQATTQTIHIQQAPLRVNTHMHTLIGPAVKSVETAVEPREKVLEFTVLCVCLCAWVAYWLGVHRAWW
jgi:hypothetical protein